MNKILFLLYYIKLRLSVAAGIHHTANPAQLLYLFFDTGDFRFRPFLQIRARRIGINLQGEKFLYFF